MKSRRNPSYRFHKASGQGVVTLNGHDHYLGPYDTPASRKRYDRLLGKWLANGRRLPSDDRKRELAVVELLLRYWRFAKVEYVRNGRPTAERYHIKTVIRIMRTRFGREPARAFGPVALKACRDELVREGQARRTVNQNVSRIRRIFRWAVENEMLEASAWHRLQAVGGLRHGRTQAKEREPVKPVPEAHVKAVLGEVAAAVAAMIQVQELTGMRPGEVCAMRLSEIDRTKSPWRYVPESHKNAYRGHERAVFIGPKAQAVLEPFLDRAADGYLFSPEEAEEARNAKRKLSRKSRMTPSQAKRKRKANRSRAWGERYDTNSYRRAIQRACKKADVPTWAPNRLRHNAATLLRDEFGLDVAQAVLGHRSPSVTAIYAEVNQDKAAAAMLRFG